MKKLDILAPGGDIDAVKAAILAGADAVYLGLPRFNARLKATNIDEQSLPDLIRLAHSYGVKIYITVNTLITLQEIPHSLELINLGLKSGANAFIVQDYGLLYLIKRLYPQAKIHASTQMTTHNSKQPELLHKLGVSQVNLCREMSLSEISELTAAAHSLGLKAEVFIHGAYCISFSGQCLMSSFIGGCSANRGLCAQPCRKLYRVQPKGEKEYLLSLKDNNAFAEINSLLEAGIDSLKIEGRMKNFYYVYTVVRAWRQQYKRVAKGLAPKQDDQSLHTVFNRDFTIGYLRGKISHGMFVDSPMDQSLILIGEIKQYTAATNLIELKKPASLYPGDQVNISAQGNNFVCTATVISTGPSPGFQLRIKGLRRGKINKGDQVYALRDVNQIKRVQEKISQLKIKRIPLEIKVEGKEGQRLQAVFAISGAKGADVKNVKLESSMVLERAKNNPLTEESLWQHFNKFGDSLFYLKSIDCSGLSGDLFLPVSELNELRRQAIDYLEYGRTVTGSTSTFLPPLPVKERIDSRLAILVSETKEAVSFSEMGLLTVLSINTAKEFQKAAVFLSSNPNNLIPFFPSIILEDEYQALAEVLDKSLCPKIIADNSGLGLAAAQKGIDWIAGPALNLTNPYTFQALHEEGRAGGVFLSPELNSQQLKKTASRINGEVWTTVLGPILMMTTRQCLLRSWAGCNKEYTDKDCLFNCDRHAVWYDERNIPFHVYKKAGLYTQIFNHALLFIPQAIPLLRGYVSYFVLDMRNFPFYHLTFEEKNMIIDCFNYLINNKGNNGNNKNMLKPDKERIQRLLPQVTSGHFRRGI